MGDLPCRVAGCFPGEAPGQLQGRLIRLHRTGQIALIQTHAADLLQGLGALFQDFVGDISGRQRLEIGHRLVVDTLHDVQAGRLRQLVVQIAEHEPDQGFGLFLPALRGLARFHRGVT